MFSFKNISKEDLQSAFRSTSQKMNVNEVIIEKDYWVSFILDYLFSLSKFKNSLVFKGGTSLSKCFGLIKRFSEDVDLILDWRVIGFKKDEPWENRSNTQQEKFAKEANQRTAGFLADKFVVEMQKDLGQLISDNFLVKVSEWDPQTILFEYPNAFNSTYVAPVIRLEIGTLAAWTPSKKVGIKPDVAKFYPAILENEQIKIRTVCPERTFWEKATILHHEANRPSNSPMPQRYSRHYYDLTCLADSSYKDSALQNLALLEKVVAFKQKFYPRKWARYEDAAAKSIRLIPDKFRFAEIKDDYHSMEEMFFGEYPTFEEIIEKLSDLEKEIQSIN